jgi:hypothetical protein
VSWYTAKEFIAVPSAKKIMAGVFTAHGVVLLGTLLDHIDTVISVEWRKLNKRGA